MIADDTETFYTRKVSRLSCTSRLRHDQVAPQKYIDMYPSKDIKILQPFVKKYPYGDASRPAEFAR